MFILIQLTWGCLQNSIGLLLFTIIYFKNHPNVERFHHSIVIHWKMHGCMSLGLFLFYNQHYPKHVLKHEYGHTIQSLLLGPFYLLIIGIPSLLWSNLSCFESYRNVHQYSYYEFYTEKWANHLADYFL